MKNKLSPYKHVIMTHADVDGIFSVINIYNIIKDPEKNFLYYAVGYHSIDKTLQKIKKESFDILWILDINLTKEQIDVIKTFSGYKKIIHIDHHSYEFNVQEYIQSKQCFEYVFVHDESISACLGVNNFIASNYPDAQKRCEKLSQIGDVYDMWRKEDPRWNQAYAINDLYWEYRYEKFFLKFRDGYKLDQEDKETILRINKERNEYMEVTINKYLQFNEEYKIAYVLDPRCKHTNHITLVYPANFYVTIKEYNDKSIAYSIRVYDPDFNLTLQEVFAIIKKEGILINSSGGHPKVGGIEVPIEENQKFLECINQIFERKLN